MSLELLRQKVKEKCENNPHLDFKPVDKIPNTKLHSYIKEVVKNSLKKRYNLFIRELLDEKNTDDFRDNFLSSAFIDLFSTKTVIGKQLEKKFENCIRSGERITKNLIEGNDISDRSFDFFAVFAEYKGGQEFLNICRSTDHTLNTEDEKNINNTRTDKPIEIPGVTVIDSNFLNQVQKKQGITKSHFFAGLQSNHTQFYGVLNQFDVERRDYWRIKETVSSCFHELRDGRISAILSGDGGSGKSTVLRKLAVELCKSELFKPIIIWIDGGNSINQFIETGLHIVKENQPLQFLLIIEDWYRMFNRIDEKIQEKFLVEINSMHNVRVLIGDRQIDKRPYMNYFAGTKQDAFHFDNKENEHILNEIAKEYPEWKRAVESLINDEKSTHSTLFLLLFIISRSEPENVRNGMVNPKEPLRTFINIIESDLKVIGRKYLGLVKALYFWATIYAHQKFFISYKTFLEIADHYNGADGKILRDFEKLERNSPSHEKLKIYIHRGADDSFQFNHDILADLGLSNIESEYVEPLTDMDKIDLLDLIIVRGDNVSASVFLSELIKDQPSLLTKEQLLNSIDILIAKGNVHKLHVDLLISLELSDSEIKNYIEDLMGIRGLQESQFWKYYLQRTTNNIELQKPIHKILEKAQEYSPFLLISIFSYLNEELFIQNFIKEVLKSNDFSNTLKDICLSHCNDKEFVHSIYLDVLSTDLNYFQDLPIQYIFDAFFFSNEATIKESLANKILKDRNQQRDFYLFQLALEYASEDKAQGFIEDVLNDEDWECIDFSTINICLKYGKEDSVKLFSDKILKREDWGKVHLSIVCNALDFASKEISQTFSNKIISNPKYLEMPKKLVSKCLIISKNRDASLSILKIFDINDWEMIYGALIVLSHDSILPVEAIGIIEKIILKKVDFKVPYLELMSINLSSDSIWMNEARFVINDWHSADHNLIVNLLEIYKPNSEKLLNICDFVLDNWKSEITKIHRLVRQNRVTCGYLLQIALGNPDLKTKSKKIAFEIFYSTEVNKELPLYKELKVMISNIIEYDIYPEWN